MDWSDDPLVLVDVTGATCRLGEDQLIQHVIEDVVGIVCDFPPADSVDPGVGIEVLVNGPQSAYVDVVEPHGFSHSFNGPHFGIDTALSRVRLEEPRLT